MRNLSISEELEIVQMAKTNIKSFELLYELYFLKIFRYCRKRVYSDEVAEDITSIVFLKAVEHIKKFDVSKDVRFGSWLFRVAHNSIIDFARKNSRQIPSIEEIVESEENNAEHYLDSYIMQQRIAYTLLQMKPRYQQIISLRFFEDMDISRIAEVMNIRKPYVSVLLHRALRMFRKKFIKFFPKSEIFSLDKRYILQDGK